MKTVKTPKKIKFSKKKAALHKVVEALIKEDMETAAQELQVYLQLKSRELLGEEAEEKEEDEKEDEKEESEDDEDEDDEDEEDEDEDEDEKEEVKESLAGFYGVETKTGNFHVKADSKEAAHAAALKKVGKPSDIKNVYFDKAKTKMKSPRKAH